MIWQVFFNKKKYNKSNYKAQFKPPFYTIRKARSYGL